MSRSGLILVNKCICMLENLLCREHCRYVRRGECWNVALVKTAFWKCTEYAHYSSSHDDRRTDSLNEYCVLNLAQRWFLDPNLTIKDLSDQVTLFVSGNPWFILIAIGRCNTVERSFLQFENGGILIALGEQFPRPNMTMVHAM